MEVFRNSGKFYTGRGKLDDAFYPCTVKRLNQVLKRYGLKIREHKRPKQIKLWRISKPEATIPFDDLQDVGAFAFKLQTVYGADRRRFLRESGL